MDNRILTSEDWEKNYQIIASFYNMLIAKKGIRAVKETIDNLLQSPFAYEENNDRWMQRILLINAKSSLEERLSMDEIEYQKRARTM